MNSFASAAGALLVLSLVPGADTLHIGFGQTQTPIPGDTSVQTLSDGRFMTMDGQNADLWAADGTFLMNLGTFPFAGATGAFRIHPTETWALVGESTSGLLFRMELDGSGVTQLATLDRNKSADWETNELALISAATGIGGDGFELWRLNINNGNLELLAALDGAPGPVGVDSTGSAFCATVAGVIPAPANSSNLYRFQPDVLVEQTATAYEFDSDNVLVLQVESVPPAGDWVEETSVPGFTGTSYYRWDGPDFFNSPGNGVLSWDFVVETSGTYQTRLYNHHDDPDSTVENDCWMRVDNGQWFKVFSGGAGSVDQWNWASSFDLAPDPSEPAHWDLTPGEHTLEISGRSNDFRIDRIHMYLEGASANELQLSKPQAFFAVQGEEVAQLLFPDLDGVSSITVDKKQDTIFIAESNPATNVNRIHIFGKAYPTTPIMVDAGADAALTNVQYIRENSPAIFYPFQPTPTGKLYYNRRDLQSQALERFVIEPARPTLSLSGPGTTGVGFVTLDMTGAWPHGWCYFLLDIAATYNPVETPLVFNGIPLVHTGMVPGQMLFVNAPIPVDGLGNFSFTFWNDTGLTNFLVWQMLVSSPSLVPFGTSEAAIL